MNYLYWIINLGSISVPFLFSFHPKLNFNKQFKYAWPAIGIVAAIFILWDIRYTHLGVWGFNPKYLSGLYLYNLPIEEVFFFICIPFSCLFTHHCFEVLINKDIFRKAEKFITPLFIASMVLLAFVSNFKLYTFYTCLSLGILLAILKYIIKVDWLNRFYFSFLILLIPFTITNGILTGTGLDEPVVWYNNSENLGIRLLTIPVEDIFYGCLLILLNVTIYEKLRNRKQII